MGRVLGFVFILVVGCGGGDEDPAAETAKRCERVRDHLIDLRLADATGVDHEAHRKAMKAALGENFMTTCKSTLSPAQAKCMLDARDRAAADACTSTQ